jgi:hypothetical protein
MGFGSRSPLCGRGRNPEGFLSGFTPLNSAIGDDPIAEPHVDLEGDLPGQPPAHRVEKSTTGKRLEKFQTNDPHLIAGSQANVAFV